MRYLGSSSARKMKHNTFTMLTDVSSLCFSDPPCHSEGLWPARGWSQWLALRRWSPRSCPTLLWTAGCSGPTSTGHPRDGEWITALNLMNYKKELISERLKHWPMHASLLLQRWYLCWSLGTAGEKKTPTWYKAVCCCWVVWSATQSAGISSIL